MDVVPPGDLSKWEHPPFGAEDGTGAFKNYVCGRGTIDMKGQGIANFLAIASLRRDGLVPERDLVFVAEPGEETYTPEAGIGWVREHRPDLLEGVTDVLNEGGVNEVSGDRIARFGIEVLQKAAIIGTAEADRREDLKAFAAFLEKEMPKEPYRVLDEVQDFLAFVAPARSDLWGHPMNDTRSAVRDGRLGEEIPEPYRALLRDMYYSGKPVAQPGGKGFTSSLLVTLLPGRSVRERWDQLQGWAGRFRVRLQLHALTADSVPVARKGRAWETLLTVLALDPVDHADVGPYVLTGSYTNSSYLRLRGEVRAFGFSPFALNILDAVTVHSHNERIFLPAYIDGVDRTARIVREYALSP
jgi:acetylornithine deacetylase/succinyl-diaminopimelate desuccinylase-like protein